jgi:hypothetical protein
MLLSVTALVHASPSGVIGWGVRHGVEPLLIGSVLHWFTLAGMIRYAHPSGYPLVVYVRFAPIPEVSPETSATQPPHLPPELNEGISLRCASSSRSVGLA